MPPDATRSPAHRCTCARFLTHGGKAPSPGRLPLPTGARDRGSPGPGSLALGILAFILAQLCPDGRQPTDKWQIFPTSRTPYVLEVHRKRKKKTLLYFILFLERKRAREQERGRGRDRESQAGSTLSTESDVGPDLMALGS